jgi:3-isopropylmalate/(R)-2-methylmalate dehydratase small subunit
MDKFDVHTGAVAPLRRSNVDTDQIIPAEYLKRVGRTGFADGLFAAWRADDPDFVLNRAEHADATILVAGEDFGTGSSREHAVWALQDAGFRVVLSPRFGDIFRGNSLKAGLLPVVVPTAVVEDMWSRAEADPAMAVTVDLVAREVRYADQTVPFDLDDHSRWRLLNGLDDISLTLRHADEIAGYEARRPGWLPRTPAAPVGRAAAGTAAPAGAAATAP